MILIAFYSEFPKWLNLLGIAACLPLLTENIVFAFTHKFSTALMALDGTGQLLFSITALCWAFRIIRIARKEFNSSIVSANSE